MEGAAQQQAGELAHRHRTITKMANMLEMHTALQEVQWRGMKSWLVETEEMLDTYHQDDVLWGIDITEMLARVAATMERDKREKRKTDTKGGGLEESIHADLTQKGGPKKPEEPKLLHPALQLKSVPMATLKPELKPNQKSNPDPISKPNPAPALGPTLTPTLRAT
jgi:hypothetical protein